IAGYPLPAGTPGGTYIIRAVYNGTASFVGSADSTHFLTVGTAVTTTTAASAAASFSAADQVVALSARVSSPAGTVGEGTETFTVLNGTTPVGSPITISVVGGSAAANYGLPAGTPGGTYSLRAGYSGTGNYAGSTDSSHTLDISP